MNINRHNYEEYFLLYVDNELNIVQRKAVESFIAENPDLKAELLILQESVLPADEHIVFSNKQSLLRTASTPNPVNETNCEEYFVLYADDELTNEQKDLVEQFVYRNPQHQASFELFQQVKLMPDTAVIFPDKYALYRKEEDDRVVPVVPMRWWKMAAAAAILLFVGGMGWYMSGTDKAGTDLPPAKGQVAFVDSNKSKQSATPVSEQGFAVTNTNTSKDQQQTTTPAIAVNTDPSNKKEGTQQPAIVKTPVTTIRPNDVAFVKEDKKEKNNEQESNNPVKTNVPPIEEHVTDPVKGYAAITIDPVKTDLGVAKIEPTVKGTELASTNKTTTVDTELLPEDPDNTYASTSDKKNKMRGFFRKVSRVFDKTANIDADGKERTGIRIASFEFALK